MSNTGIIAISFLAVLVALIMLFSNLRIRYGNKRNQDIFSLMILFNILSLITSALYYTDLVSFSTFLTNLNIVFLAISFYMVELLFTETVMNNIMHVTKRDQIIRVCIHIFVLVSMVIWILPATDILDVKDPVLFWAGQIPGWVVTTLIILLILLHRKELGRRNTTLYLVYLIIPMIGMILRNITGIVGLQHVGMTVSLLLLHSAINMEQSIRLQEEQRENEVNKTRMMLTQIKPHFIYNSLNTIYYLCEKDPKEAQKAISEFSDYLRGNIDSLTEDEMIPFKKELEHIRHYLYLECLRYSEDLNVKMDINCTDFNVPALSIQLLVENAIKHGIGHKPGGGTVTIHTHEEDDAYVIRVSDDGNGFDPKTIKIVDEDRTHIGLVSVRSRIQNAGGTVTIDSEPEKGTAVTVRIRKTSAEDPNRESDTEKREIRKD
ncbi:MAG: histidine kinase [Solobacterium sp.]|nr:histidine kinase [Solobacterium sp.]